MNRDDFAVFILTHGRANNVVTHKTLRTCGYTGKIYLMVDNEDKQIDEYKKKYGEYVIVFDKQKAIDYTDSGDNFKKRNSVVYARNWNFIVAKEMGIKYFWQLDDDYTTFRHTADENKQYTTKQSKIKDLDYLLACCVDYFEEGGFHALAFSQGGDFIGGPGSAVAKKTAAGTFSRKVMNSFIFSSERPVKFPGRINEDVNMYVTLGLRGYLFATIGQLRLEQIQTQANNGGLTDIYLDLGTYVKSFYSVMYAPSCVKISEMGNTHRRIHHLIEWKKTTPMILSEEYRKPKKYEFNA
jgi:hypothetical protein